MGKIIDFPQAVQVSNDISDLPKDVTVHEIYAVAAAILERVKRLNPDNALMPYLSIDALFFEAIRNITERHRRGER